MYKKLFIIILILACLDIALVKGGGGGGVSRGSSRSRADGPMYGRRAYYGGQYPQTMAADPPQSAQTPKEYLDQKSGFSTFGIISIIFGIIVFCLAFYYAIMCYPLLFRDEKKYRRYMSDISSTTTAVTSRSLQSIQHYPSDEKH